MNDTNVGTVSYDVRLNLTQLTKDTAAAEKIIKDSNTKIAKAQATPVAGATKASTNPNATGASVAASIEATKQAAQASFNTMSQYAPRIQAQFVAVQRANMNVESASLRASAAIEKYGSDSVQAVSATNRLSSAVLGQATAQSRLSTSLANTGETAKSATSFMSIGFASAATAAVALGVAIGSNLSGAVNRTDVINQFPKIMSNFGVSTDDATASMQRLVAAVHGLPTSLNDIANLTEAFTPMSTSVANATTLAIAFNDALLAGGQSADIQANAMEQFRQALAKGMPQLQDWRSIETAMPAQLQQVGKQLGLGSGLLKDYANNGQGIYNAMTDGKLSLGQFESALVQLDQNGNGVLPSFEEQAKNASNGIGTSLTVLSQNIQQGIANVFNAIGTSNIQAVLGSIGSAFTTTFNGIASVINFVKSIAGSSFVPLIVGIGTAISSFIAMAGAIYVAVRALTALGVAVDLSLGPVGILLALLSVAAGITLANLGSGMDDTATSAAAVDSSVSNFTPALDQATSSASDLAKQMAKIDEQAQKAQDDFNQQLAQLVQAKNQDIAQLQQELQDEKTAYDDAYAERLTSFNKSQNDELATHAQKVKELQNQIDFLTKYNSAANQQQLSSLKFALAQENAQYKTTTDAAQDEFDAQTQSAKDSYDEQYTANKAKLDADTALLEAHREDVLSIQNVMVDDEIDSLKKQRDAQLASLQQQRDDIVSQLGGAAQTVAAQTGQAATDAAQKLATAIGYMNAQLITMYGQAAKTGDVTVDSSGQLVIKLKQGGTPAYSVGFATGGYTGAGGENDVAGIVHRGEYVLPKSSVDQTTGMPKAISGGNVNVSLSLSGVMSSSPSDERQIAMRMAKRINEALKAKGKPLIAGV